MTATVWKRAVPFALSALAIAGWAVTVRAQSSAAEGGKEAEMPDPNADLSAHRIDSEVFGWNKKYTEMGVLGSNVTRGRRGEHRGEMFLLIFDIGANQPKRNVHVLAVTQAALPHNPIVLEDVRSRMWAIDHVYQRMWSRRPKRKWFKGAMRIEPVWESVEVEPGICQPAVGFLLDHKGKRRYQPHQPVLEIRTQCDNLRLIDTRTYWAKKDLGAVMMQWELSPTENESSYRFPFSASWEISKSLHLVIEVPKSQSAELRKKLQRYGRVSVESGDAKSGLAVQYRDAYAYLGRRIATELGVRVVSGAPPEGVDIQVISANVTPVAAEEATVLAPTPKADSFEDGYECSGLLRDCDR